MPPEPKDVGNLVGALFTLMGAMQRARRTRPDAAALSVLQIIGAVEREEPGRGVRPSELAELLDVHRSAVTHHVRTLSQAGHISLTTDPADRRSSLISLTASGHAEVERLTAYGMARFTSFVADWSDADVHEFTRLLHKFTESAAAVNARQPEPQEAHS